MTYSEWKAILEPLSLLLAGAGSVISFQRVFKSMKGLPPCEPDEIDKAILASIDDLKNTLSKFDRRLSEAEKTAKSRR